MQPPLSGLGGSFVQKTLFAAALERHGNRIALVDGDGTAPSYATLAALADRLMLETNQAQVGLIEFAHTIDAIAAYLGALRQGLPVILTSPGQPERTAALIDRFRPDCVFRDGHWANLPGSNWREAPPHPNLAILLSTSGSTGDPRLVRLSHGNIQSNADAIVAYLGLRASDRAITALPLHHGFGLSVLHAQLAVGGSLIVTEARIGTQAFQALCFRHRCTIVATVPHGYDLLERTGFMDDCPSMLRILQQAGGRMEPEAVLRWAKWAKASGRPIVLFPEGTRIPPGEQPPLRAGLAGLYKILGLPVIPVALSAGHQWPKGFVKYAGPVRMKVGAPIPPGLSREEIERRVHEAINVLNG